MGGRLGWNGEAWFWESDSSLTETAQAVTVGVGLDVGYGLLLWVRFANGSSFTRNPLAFAWLQADAIPTKWHGLRCAVYSRPNSDQIPTISDRDRF